jgi:phage repressor protein C with HTH and peptisase S24 domain
MRDRAVDYLRHVLDQKGWTAADLARRAGVAHSTINRPLTIPDYPNAISRQTIQKVWQASGIDPSPFTDAAPALSVVTGRPETNGIQVSVYDVSASAGHGSFVEAEEVIDRLSFPPDYLRHITTTNPRDLAIISVLGDSMLPTLAHKDVVMLDMTKRDLSFDGLYVIKDGGASLLVKRIGRGSMRGYISIISDNPRYGSRERPIEETEVVGRVVWIGAKV